MTWNKVHRSHARWPRSGEVSDQSLRSRVVARSHRKSIPDSDDGPSAQSMTPDTADWGGPHQPWDEAKLRAIAKDIIKGGTTARIGWLSFRAARARRVQSGRRRSRTLRHLARGDRPGAVVGAFMLPWMRANFGPDALARDRTCGVPDRRHLVDRRPRDGQRLRSGPVAGLGARSGRCDIAMQRGVPLWAGRRQGSWACLPRSCRTLMATTTLTFCRGQLRRLVKRAGMFRGLKRWLTRERPTIRRKNLMISGRSGRIRTCDPCVPNAVSIF